MNTVPSEAGALLRGVDADGILRANGMTGPALLKLSLQCANHYANRHPAFPASRVEDLAQHCALHVCRRAPKYDALLNNFDAGKNPSSSPFRSWVWMQMEAACGDFVRQRKEGFVGRIGRDKEITVQLTDTPDDYRDPVEVTDEFELAADEERLRLWNRAASVTGWSLPEWLAITADHAARDLLGNAA